MRQGKRANCPPKGFIGTALARFVKHCAMKDLSTLNKEELVAEFEKANDALMSLSQGTYFITPKSPAFIQAKEHLNHVVDEMHRRKILGKSGKRLV